MNALGIVYKGQDEEGSLIARTWTSITSSECHARIDPLKIHDNILTMAATQQVPRGAYINFYNAHAAYFERNIPNAANVPCEYLRLRHPLLASVMLTHAIRQSPRNTHWKRRRYGHSMGSIVRISSSDTFLQVDLIRCLSDTNLHRYRMVFRYLRLHVQTFQTIQEIQQTRLSFRIMACYPIIYP